MRPSRTLLILAATLVVGAIAAPSASAVVTVTQANSPDPVDQGGTVSYQVTLTSDIAEPDLRAHINISRPGSQAGVDSTYQSYSAVSPNPNPCVLQPSSLECSFGGVTPNQPITLTMTVLANESFAQNVLAYKCTTPPPQPCDFQDNLGSSSVATQVNYPTEFSGSNKLKLSGIPAECTNSSFKAKVKAKAKKVSRIYASLKGPKSEFGNALPVSGVSGQIAKTDKRKLKVRIRADELDPGFYDLKFAAKRKGGPQLKSKAVFQVCGPTFGL